MGVPTKPSLALRVEGFLPVGFPGFLLCPFWPMCPEGLVLWAAWAGTRGEPSRLSFDLSLGALCTAGIQYMLCSCSVALV